MCPSPPNRTLQQRKAALRKANEIRSKRSQLKLNLKAGRVHLATVCGYILHPPDWLETMKVFDLLVALPKYGRTKVNTLMKRTRVSFTKTLGGLSPRQRDDLVSHLK